MPGACVIKNSLWIVRINHPLSHPVGTGRPNAATHIVDIGGDAAVLHVDDLDDRRTESAHTDGNAVLGDPDAFISIITV